MLVVKSEEGMAVPDDSGAFINRILLRPPSIAPELPLRGLSFAVKDIGPTFGYYERADDGGCSFDVEGQLTGFGNPDWARTHAVASSTAPAVLSILRAGATCVGKTFMDEMAFSINGENKHYGTPTNPHAADHVPGGSSSGSAVAVGAKLVNFSLGTDTCGSIRVPASYCGILGFRPSHNLVTTAGVIPMAQSFDTVGWFARDPFILKQVGRVLLQLPVIDPIKPTQIIIPKDCFGLSSIPYELTAGALAEAVESLFGGEVIKYTVLGDYVKENVPALSSFFSMRTKDDTFSVPSLAALSRAMRLLQCYEFKKNHGEWVSAAKPELGPGIAERVRATLETTDEKIGVCLLVKEELNAALAALIGDYGILAIPTVPGPPPKLQTDPSSLEIFRGRAFSLLSIAGVSGFCQVSMPLGIHKGLPYAVSLVAKHGSDGFLLDTVEILHGAMNK